MLRAKIAMTTDVITVKRDTPIYEAVEILIKNNISGLPVVDDEGVLIGVVTEKDMLELLYNPNSEYGTVEEFMTEDVTAFDENDNLIDVCECLIKYNFRRVPILSNGKLSGIISRRDIIKFTLELRKESKVEEEA